VPETQCVRTSLPETGKVPRKAAIGVDEEGRLRGQRGNGACA